MENKELWEALEQKCKDCTACELYKTKTNTVFGKGSKSATVLFVGEAPGEQEDLQGIPFCGASGQLLDKYFASIDMKPEEYYVGNILKCRPPYNRDPSPEEQEACIGHLREQLKLINPKIIVCLGRIAAMKIIKPDFRITREHGQWFKKGRFYITAVYHPSMLLRDPAKREETMRDFLEIEKKLIELRESDS
ncbi:MAG: uracil-DNA glycosylase [Clostridia bacterium]|nr:uracil-DNA glycosylase [Clostridia bacterium]